MMKEFTSAGLLLAFLFSACIPTSAQKTRSIDEIDSRITSTEKVKAPSVVRKPIFRPSADKGDFAQFEKVEAFSDGSGSVLKWEMASESGNVGFDVFRIGPKGYEKVNESLIAGSFAKLGKQEMLGETYTLFDPTGGLNSAYVIQAMGQDGTRLSSNTFNSKYTYDIDGSTGLSKKSLSAAATNTNGVIESTQPFQALRRGGWNTGTSDVTANITSDLTMHRWVVAQPGAKISVKTEGMYRVRLSELQAASSTFTSANTANWRLYKEGIEQAINIGSDGNGPYLEFYGKGIDTPESDTRVYYVIVDTAPGKRMASRSKKVQSIGTSTNYSAVTEKKERSFYASTILNGDAENWWGRLIYNSPQNIPITLTGVDPSVTSGILTLKMQTFSTQVSPSVNVVLNGHPIGTVNGYVGQGAFSGQLSFDTAFLNEGSNALQLTALNGGSDRSLFDTVTIRYGRNFKSNQNKLIFPLEANKQVYITGYSTPNVRTFDLSSEGNPVILSSPTIVPEGSTYTVQVPAQSTRTASASFPGYAIENSSFLTAASVTTNTPSNLSSTIRNADLIIISYSTPDFMAAANTWAAYRSGQGFNVAVVDIADVLDEFSYGSLKADAINDFLHYANENWTPQVAGKQYVLLLGDASYDPRNYLGLATSSGFGNFDMVPTKMVTTVYTETGSDDALADFNGDGLAEMSVGRIPARTVSFINTVFAKTVAFEDPVNNMQSLDRGTVLAYDVPNGYDFGSMSVELGNQLPAAMPKNFVPRGIQPTPPGDPLATDPNAKANVIAALNTGPYIANYSGHGAQSFWASSGFFGYADVPLLNNGSSLSIVTMLTCLNGYFISPDTGVSIGEVLLQNPNGGAVASWASTGLTTADVQMLMGRQFYTQIGVGNINRMGDLIRDAKAVIPAGADVRFSWVLLGDPMLKVRL